MKKIKINYLSTLFVEIDIGSRTNVISAINFDQDFLIRMVPVANAQGAEQMAEMVTRCFHSTMNSMPSTSGWSPLAFTAYISPTTCLPPKNWPLFPQRSTASIRMR